MLNDLTPLSVLVGLCLFCWVAWVGIYIYKKIWGKSPDEDLSMILRCMWCGGNFVAQSPVELFCDLCKRNRFPKERKDCNE